MMESVRIIGPRTGLGTYGRNFGILESIPTPNIQKFFEDETSLKVISSVIWRRIEIFRNSPNDNSKRLTDQ